MGCTPSVVSEVVQEHASVNTYIKERCKISSSNKYEDHLEEQENKKTDETMDTEKVTVEAAIDVRTMGE